MPRSPTGDYTLPLPPVITGTTIEASWANSTLADMQQALTDSLSRSNQGNMQQHFLAVDGSISAPGIAFVNEAGTGFYRPNAGDLYLAVLGVDYMRWTDDNGVQIWDGVTWYEVVDSNQLDSAIAGLQSQITTNTQGSITAQSFDGTSLTSTRAAGDLVTGINTFSVLKPNGPITHKLLNTVSIDLSLSNRWAVENNGSITLTFSSLPASVAPFGTTFQTEGQVIVWNGATPGSITINGLTGARILGSPSTIANSVGVLSYMIQRVAGVNRITLIWSAV